ncbi:MAG: enoyl-CoA hydratase/isomerase family protein, partial [Rhodobacterales bacterium]
INGALAQEYRFTHRAVEHSDFIEGIRAAIIDKDRKPRWQALTDAAVTNMIAPLGSDAFEVTGETP